MLQAIIFDFDGLILDTESLLYQAWADVCRSLGVTLSRHVWLSYVGTRNAFLRYDDLEKELGRPIDREAVQTDYENRTEVLLAAEPIRPGILSYLKEAEQRGLKTGIASNSDRSWVTGHLQRLGLTPYFPHVACGNEVSNPKPAPDVYQGIMEVLGVQPHSAIALEDSPPGVESAKAAGLFTVAVPNPLTKEMDLSAADIVVDSLATFTLDMAVQQYLTLGSRAADRN